MKTPAECDPRSIAATLAEMEFRELARVNQGTAGVFWSEAGGPSPWEMHPDCDEVLQVLDGAIEVDVLPLRSGPAVRTRVPAGSFFVVPRGCWHRQTMLVRTTELYVTPGPSRTSHAADPRADVRRMHLDVRDGITITDIEPSDKPAYLAHFREPEFSERITMLPFPYTEADADRWLAYLATDRAKQQRSVDWALRDRDGRLIGGIGFTGLQVGTTHRAEFGYWLAKALWGRGIMTDAVRAACGFAFAELGLERITATVFDFNPASARVLEKAGFQLEGRLRGHLRKNGTTSDVLTYARLAP